MRAYRPLDPTSDIATATRRVATLSFAACRTSLAQTKRLRTPLLVRLYDKRSSKHMSFFTRSMISGRMALCFLIKHFEVAPVTLLREGGRTSGHFQKSSLQAQAALVWVLDPAYDSIRGQLPAPCSLLTCSRQACQLSSYQTSKQRMIMTLAMFARHAIAQTSSRHTIYPFNKNCSCASYYVVSFHLCV